MHLDLAAGTALWDWYYSGASFVGFVASVLISAMVIRLSGWGARGIFFKTVIVGATLAAMPLGLASVGLRMAISNPGLMSITSIVGVTVAIVFGLPFILQAWLSRKNESQKLQSEDLTWADSISDEEITSISPPAAEQTVRTGNQNIYNDDVTANHTLAFRSGARQGETVEVMSPKVTLGRSPDNDIVIDEPSVSRNHAVLTTTNGHYVIEDLGSMNGTKVDGTSVSKQPVASGTPVLLGDVEIVVGQIGEQDHQSDNTQISHQKESPDQTVVRKPVPNTGWLAVNNSDGAADVYRLKPGANVIGRDAECDLPLNDPYISRKHAIVSFRNGKASVSDLGSRGGIKVNEQAIAGTAVTTGFEIAVGETVIKLVSVESPVNFDGTQNSEHTRFEKGPSKAVVAMVISGPDAGKSFRLNEGANLIGRTPGCAINLTDGTVSKVHAQIMCAGDKMSVADLDSRTGTKVGNKPVTGTSISNGDVVSIGQTRFTLMGAAA